MLLARLFESLPLVYPNCGADMRIIAFVTEVAPVQRILAHIGVSPPRATADRTCPTPPAWDKESEPMPDGDLVARRDPGFEFDQRIAWQPQISARHGAAAPDLAPGRRVSSLRSFQKPILAPPRCPRTPSVASWPTPPALANLSPWATLGSQGRLDFLFVIRKWVYC